MRSITQWIVGVSAVGVASIGSAVAQEPPEQSKVIGQEVSTSKINLPLSDHQRLKRYFLDGSRDRQKAEMRSV